MEPGGIGRGGDQIELRVPVTIALCCYDMLVIVNVGHLYVYLISLVLLVQVDYF
jgi:hypothetical protein